MCAIDPIVSDRGIPAAIFEISLHYNDGISDLSINSNNISNCQKAGLSSTLDRSAQHGLRDN